LGFDGKLSSLYEFWRVAVEWIIFFNYFNDGIAAYLFSTDVLEMMKQSLLAFQGLPPIPEDIWSRWSWEPFVLLGLLLGGWFYFRGVWQLWQQAGAGRVIGRWQVGAFGLGLAVLFIALISPLNSLSTTLFSAHMLQHLLLILIAAPLLVLGAPLIPLLWALPKSVRRAAGRWWKSTRFIQTGWHILTIPWLVWLLHTITLWFWHLPRLYQAALEQVFLHELEHLSFFGTALLFWWILIQSGGSRRLEYGSSILFVFATALQSGALGALLTFAQTPLYPIYTSSVTAWGLTLLEDQQLAGLIMWIPASVVYLLAALLLFMHWLQAGEQKIQHREERVLTHPSI
jgi:putative membrane protein